GEVGAIRSLCASIYRSTFPSTFLNGKRWITLPWVFPIVNRDRTSPCALSLRMVILVPSVPEENLMYIKSAPWVYTPFIWQDPLSLRAIHLVSARLPLV